MSSFDLKLGRRPARSCPVHVGSGATRALIDFVRDRAGDGVVVLVSDSEVAPLYGEPLRRAWVSRGLAVDLVVFPAGETSKTRETKSAIEDRLATAGVGRDGWIVAVGGGVAGDLAGFVASTWNRGIRWVQAPTSLVAMVDAAIGGKTGVDLPAGKNLIGAFHPPEAVFSDIDTLETLPEEEMRQGFAELVKTAAVADIRLFRAVERDAGRLLARDRDATTIAISSCARRKARIVSRDERDAGSRAALNFGHTVGHAIEHASRYRVPHGDAVAVGMIVEARLAERLAGFPATHTRRLRRALERFGLPSRSPVVVEAATLDAAMRLDKKRAGRSLRCALPAKLGRMPDDVLTDVPVESILDAFRETGADGSTD